MTIRGMGYVPDVPKLKDYTPKHDAVAPLLAKTRYAAKPKGKKAAAAPSGKVDLRKHFSEIEDQLSIGSCTAQAAIGLLEYFQKRSHGRHTDHSRLFTYKATRNLLGWDGDTGAYIRTAMESLVRFGSPPEKYWPYDVTRYDEEPAAFLYSLADEYEAINYFRLDPTGTSPAQTLDMLKMCLDAGFPAMFGFPVYAEFMTPQASGKVPFPNADSQYFGGHAVIAAGYDDKMTVGSSKGALIVRNSWGTGWGKDGYCYMSYDYVTEALALDFWTLISADWVDDGQFA